MKFDVHRSNYPASDLGELLTSIDASSHRAARQAADKAYPDTAVVVIPTPKPNAKLARATRRLQAANGTKRDTRSPPRGRRRDASPELDLPSPPRR